MYTRSDIRLAIHAYLVCALWSSHDWRSEEESPDYNPDAGENMDDSFSPEDIESASYVQARKDFFYFLRQCAEAGIDLEKVSPDITQHAHDLWLTRNHHGAGFWDRGYPKAIGDKLTDIAHGMGECSAVAISDSQFIIE